MDTESKAPNLFGHLDREERPLPSGRHIEQIVESLADPLVAFDRQWRYTYVNRRAAESLGKTPQEMLGRSMWELFPADSETGFQEACQRAWAENAPVTIERYSNVLNLWVESYVYPFENGASSQWRDITLRKRAEDALRESELRYRTLFESIDEGFCIIEIIFDESNRPVDYRFIEVNQSFERQTGLADVEGKTIRQLAPLHEQHWFEFYGQIAITGKPARFENRAEQLNRWYSAYAFRFGAPENRHVAVLFNDISERKRSEERLMQAQKMESVGLLAGGIAHDFNNLLTGIVGNASLLLEQVGPAHAERARAVINTAEKAANLTRQLLAYAGKGQFIVKDLNVSETVCEISRLAEHSIPTSVQLVLNVERRVPDVRMDPSQLEQVLMNLVINAGEAIEPGNPGKITISTASYEVKESFTDAIGQEVSPGRYASIQVNDTGCGIEQAKQARIFDPFVTTKFTGRGLGLAAVAGILRSVKGAVILQSTPGEGTTFRVLLPASEAYLQSAPDATPIAGKGTILVVDDEPTVREFICFVLRRAGYQVLTASDGREALAVFDAQPGGIDGVVMDLIMPLMGAKEVLPIMMSRMPDVAVLLTSGYSESEARQLCDLYPAARFIQKPYTAKQMEESVAKLFSAESKGWLRD